MTTVITIIQHRPAMTTVIVIIQRPTGYVIAIIQRPTGYDNCHSDYTMTDWL